MSQLPGDRPQRAPDPDEAFERGPLSRGAEPAIWALREPPKPRLDCGCPTEKAAEHAAQDEEQRGRHRRVIEGLKQQPPRRARGLRIKPLGRVFLDGVWEYFEWLYNAHREQYPEFVETFARAHRPLWRRPACRRDRGILDPIDVAELPRPPAVIDAKKRGRKKDPEVQALYKEILALHQAGRTLLEGIAEELDKRGRRIPKSWARRLPRDQHTWMAALLDKDELMGKDTVRKFFSRVFRK